jgi:potassium-transporting ATPase KdpC subunit
MLDHLRRSVVLALICLIFFGFVYAFAGTGVAQLFFRHQADGSITANGSTLIGQNWSEVKCPGHMTGSCIFHGRPTDTGPYHHTEKNDVTGGDNPLEATGVPGESGATNLGPRSQTLVTNTKALVTYWQKLGVPHPTADLVTTSGSGYDPDITPADALVQVPMVSKATGISQARLRTLVAKATSGPELGFLGASTINVLQLNEGLAHLK